MPIGKFALSNQKHYPDLGSDVSSVWGFYKNICSLLYWRGLHLDSRIAVYLGQMLKQHHKWEVHDKFSQKSSNEMNDTDVQDLNKDLYWKHLLDLKAFWASNIMLVY